MDTLAIDHIIKECLAADVIVCAGAGKSACIATLTAEFLQSTGVVAISTTPEKLGHGGFNVLNNVGKMRYVVLMFTHSGQTYEMLHAMRYIREYDRTARDGWIDDDVFIVAVSSVDVPLAHITIKYDSPVEDNVHGIPVYASMSQFTAVSPIINAVANGNTRERMKLGHPGGTLYSKDV